MANNYWLGTTDAVAQVSTYQITAFDAATTYKVTVNGVEVSVLGDTDVNTTATNLQVALEASTNPYFTPITWTVATDTVTGTGPVGMPFTAAGSVSGGTGTMSYTAEATAATGPEHWDEAGNWSQGTVPVSTDNVVIENSDVNIRWGLDQSSVVLTSLIIKKSYTGRIGLVANAVATTGNGDTFDATELEYRARYLDIQTSKLNIGENFSNAAQSGSDMIKVDIGATACDIRVFSTASTTAETGKPAVQLLTNSASTNLYVRSCPANVGIATGEPFETSTLAKIEIGDEVTTGGVRVGSGVTLTTFTQKSGTNYMELAATLTTLTVDGGTLYTEGDYTITTANVSNTGSYNSNHIKTSGSAITTLNLNLDGTVNTLGNSEPRTFGTVNFAVGATLVADSNILTITTFNEPSGKYTLITET